MHRDGWLGILMLALASVGTTCAESEPRVALEGDRATADTLGLFFPH